MLRNASAVLAVLLVLGSSGLSTSALARGGGNRLPDDHFSGGFRDILRGGHRDYEDRTRGLGDRFHRDEGRDMWGHWGAYYGPMIPSI
jgi:hypothetical protein